MPVTFTPQDITNVGNLVKLLAKVKVELDGAAEIMAASEVLRWVGRLSKQIEESVKLDSAPKTVMPPPQPQPESVEQPEAELTKKKRK